MNYEVLLEVDYIVAWNRKPKPKPNWNFEDDVFIVGVVYVAVILVAAVVVVVCNDV